MLYQLHHQHADGTSDFCAQREINGDEEMRQFFEDTQKSHPLKPEAKCWLMVPEDSPQFMMTVAEDS